MDHGRSYLGKYDRGTDYFNVFDFDHITFIQKGQNSQYPIPPGGYKFESDQHSKDISVQFAPVFPTNLPQVAVSADFPAEVLSGFSFKGKVKVTNNGSVLYPSNMGVIESMTLYPRRQEVTIPPLPPFGSEYLTVGFNKTPFLTNKKYDFTFNLQGTIIHKSVKVTPFSFNRNTLIGGSINCYTHDHRIFLCRQSLGFIYISTKIKLLSMSGRPKISKLVFHRISPHLRASAPKPVY